MILTTRLSLRNITGMSCVLIAFLLLLMQKAALAVEFTFDLADNSEDCFYEEIKRNTSAYLEYQVSAGGQLDVDVQMKNPQGHVIYEKDRLSYDSFQFVAESTGIYEVCFSNKFSSFSHKFIYVDFQVGEEPTLPGIEEHATALTQMETSSQSIHRSLNDILDAQTHHRLREAQGRKRAEELNERVMWWSCIETAVILIIGIGQILILRNFFTDRKPSQGHFNRL